VRDNPTDTADLSVRQWAKDWNKTQWRLSPLRVLVSASLDKQGSHTKPQAGTAPHEAGHDLRVNEYTPWSSLITPTSLTESESRD
jgi:hypothetical protein